MANLKKNSKGYGYKYTDLAEINSYIESIGGSYEQYTETTDGVDYIVTVKIDADGCRSEPLRGSRVPDAKLPDKSNPAQEYGSGLTYARRYSLLMAYGLATTDDDAQCFTREPDKGGDKITGVHAIALRKRLAIDKVDEGRILTHYGLSKLEDMSMTQLSNCNKMLADLEAGRAHKG